MFYMLNSYFLTNHPHFSFPVTEKWTFFIQDPRPLKQWHSILKQPWFWGSKSRFPIPGQPRMDCSCQICLREQPGRLQGHRTQLPEFRMFCSTAAVLLCMSSSFRQWQNNSTCITFTCVFHTFVFGLCRCYIHYWFNMSGGVSIIVFPFDFKSISWYVVADIRVIADAEASILSLI